MTRGASTDGKELFVSIKVNKKTCAFAVLFSRLKLWLSQWKKSQIQLRLQNQQGPNNYTLLVSFGGVSACPQCLNPIKSQTLIWPIRDQTSLVFLAYNVCLFQHRRTYIYKPARLRPFTESRGRKLQQQQKK